MTVPTIAAAPAEPAAAGPLRAEFRAFGTMDPATWDRRAAASPWATPFSAWAFHRAWWDAYGENATDETLIVLDPVAGPDADPVAIVPLMHRHEVEPTDAILHTTIRHGAPADLTPVPASAKALFFGASYHADYATILARPADLPAVAAAVVDHLAAAASQATTPGHPTPWDVVDLRRLRAGDPTADALAAAFGAREIAEGWTLNLEHEDVCPVATIPAGVDLDGFLATLAKSDRHEIRRKVRRAEAAGEVRLDPSPDPLEDLEAFIDLHQRRWGADGLFPPTPGGDASRVFVRRLFELFGPDGPVRLAFLTVDGRRIAAGITFETDEAILYYNAGVDPEARALSPGVVLVERYVRHAIETGRHRIDFLRGDESYKYEWGALDEPVRRLLVRRRVAG